MLRKWPVIMLAVLVCALLFGASSYFTSEPEEVEVTLEEGELGEVELKKAQEIELANIKQEIKQLQILRNNFRESEVAKGLLDLNMHGTNFYNLSFMVKGEEDSSDIDRAGLALSYANQIATGAIYQHLSIGDSVELAEQLPQLIAAYAEEGVVFICAYGVEDIEIREIVHDIFDYIESISNPSSVKLLMAEEGVLPQSFYRFFTERQESTVRRLDYYEHAIGIRVQAEEILEVETGIMGEGVQHSFTRRVIVGCAAGIVLGVFIGLLMDFFGTTLKDERELEYMGLYNLCGANIQTSKKKRFFLNRFIDFLDGKVYYHMSEEEQVTYIMAKIVALFVDKEETQDILLTGVAESKEVRNFYERLQAKGKEEGYHFILGENANISAKTVASLGAVKHVILIERFNESKLTEISKICQLVEQQKKEIVGFLVV